MGFFDDLLKKVVDYISRLWDDLKTLADFAGETFSLLTDLRAQIAKMVKDSQKEIAGIEADLGKFLDRAADVQTKLIRADEVFKLTHEIVSGELLKWLQNEFRTVGSTLTDAANAMIEGAKGVNSFKTPSLNSLTTGPVVKMAEGVKKIITTWVTIGKVVEALTGIVPVLKDIREKLKQFESIILPQDSSRTSQQVTYYKRQRS